MFNYLLKRHEDGLNIKIKNNNRQAGEKLSMVIMMTVQNMMDVNQNLDCQKLFETLQHQLSTSAVYEIFQFDAKVDWGIEF